RAAPARGGARGRRPGKNFATSSAPRPRRKKRFSVFRTHESGSREIRHRRARIRPPRRRPSSYQMTSGGNDAASAAANANVMLIRPEPVRAPTARRTGARRHGQPRLLRQYEREQQKVAVLQQGFDVAHILI